MYLKEVVKKRWKFYISTYILGYLISLISTGIPNLMYLQPVKLVAIGLAIVVGNTLYYASNKLPTYRIPLIAVKYFLIMTIIAVVFKLLTISMSYLDIDIETFIGLPI